ncbi:MAG: M1 family metallopeptidase [Limisphaerales bacterium]
MARFVEGEVASAANFLAKPGVGGLNSGLMMKLILGIGTVPRVRPFAFPDVACFQRWIAIGMLLALGSGCGHSPASSRRSLAKARVPAGMSVHDEHSFAQPEVVGTRHLSLDLQLDFDRRILSGTATLSLVWRDPDAKVLILDTRDLAISGIEARLNGAWTDVPYEIAEPDPILGSRLTLRLPRQADTVRIAYAASPSASGLQWLTPAMTLGKKTPFLFSQSQQIHARSWVPLQDTPQVRFTYDARVRTTPEVMVLMSADNDPAARRDGDYRFEMPQPIPSYLLAIAAGDLVFQPITRRTGVWAEPAMVGSAAYEFADTGRMMETAESLYGPYRWGRYDILVLPPSFPYGGMENPRLTFASPTVITGDRSLVSLVAHELAHSWSGNLVTFSSNRDMWLNEGFTTYVESRIVEALYGKERADMENITARDELAAEFTDENRNLQVLAIPAGALPDPDGHLTGTVYTKGAWFLEFLEQRFGRKEFDAFLRGYFDHFAFQSISTPEFVEYAREHLIGRYPGRIRQDEFDAWLHEPGVPSTAPQAVSPRLRAVEAGRATWLAGGILPPPSMTGDWSTQEWTHFLAGMPAVLTRNQLQSLDEAFRFTGTSNAEIARVWYPLTIRGGYDEARPAIEEYLVRVGRRRMVMSIYQALAKTPEGLAFARGILAKARDSMHPITAGSVEAVLADPAAQGAP